MGTTALRQGLAHRLNDFCVPLNEPTPDRRLAIVDAKTGADLGQSLFAFRPQAQYMAAVAIEGGFPVYPSFRRFSS